MSFIAKYLHWSVIGWALMAFYGSFEAHQARLSSAGVSIPSLEVKVKEKEKEKQLFDEYFKDIDEAKRNIERVAVEIEKLQKKLPATISDTENLELLSVVAKGLNIKDVYLAPQGEVDKGFYFSKKYEFKASGTFLQFLIFLENISDTERILNIHSMKLEKTKERQKGRFQLVNATIEVEAFRYNPNYREDRGIEELEIKEKEEAKKAAPNKKNRKKSADKLEV